MEYINGSGFPTAGLIVGLVAGVFIALTAYGIDRNLTVNRAKDKGALFFVLTLCVFGSGLCGMVLNSLAEDDAVRKLRMKAIDETYSMTVASEDFSKLDYPSSKPTSDFEIFGNFENQVLEDDEFKTTNIYLIWEDDSFKLYNISNLDDFSEVKAK